MWLNQPIANTAEVFLSCWDVQGPSTVLTVRPVPVSGASPWPFSVSGINSGCGHTGRGADGLLSFCSAVRLTDVGTSLFSTWACSTSMIMALRCLPPLSVCILSDSTLAKPSKSWTVATTPFDSRLLKVCSTSCGHSAGKCSLPRNRQGGKAMQTSLRGCVWQEITIFFVSLTSKGAASDLEGELQQVHGNGYDAGKWYFLSVSVICIEDTDLPLTDFEDHCPVPVIVTYKKNKKQNKHPHTHTNYPLCLRALFCSIITFCQSFSSKFIFCRAIGMLLLE